MPGPNPLASQTTKKKKDNSLLDYLEGACYQQDAGKIASWLKCCADAYQTAHSRRGSSVEPADGPNLQVFIELPGSSIQIVIERMLIPVLHRVAVRDSDIEYA